MKMTLNVDCTPAEAREFIGLPDLRPLHASVLDKLEQRMSASLDELSPEALLKRWLYFGADGATQIQELFKGFLARAPRDGAAET